MASPSCVSMFLKLGVLVWRVTLLEGRDDGRGAGRPVSSCMGVQLDRGCCSAVRKTEGQT